MNTAAARIAAAKNSVVISTNHQSKEPRQSGWHRWLHAAGLPDLIAAAMRSGARALLLSFWISVLPEKSTHVLQKLARRTLPAQQQMIAAVDGCEMRIRDARRECPSGCERNGRIALTV